MAQKAKLRKKPSSKNFLEQAIDEAGKKAEKIKEELVASGLFGTRNKVMQKIGKQKARKKRP